MKFSTEVKEKSLGKDIGNIPFDYATLVFSHLWFEKRAWELQVLAGLRLLNPAPGGVKLY